LTGSNQRIDAETETLVVHSLRGEGFDASEDGTGRGTPLVPVCFSAKDYGADARVDAAPTLRAGSHDNSHANEGCALAVATLAIRGRGEDSNIEYRTDGTANALLTPNGGRAGIGVGAVQYGEAVRRLTPRECERLQGFRDDYTLIRLSGAQRRAVDAEMAAYYRRTNQVFTDAELRRLAADGPRYKALGNSMAVPVMRWLGDRLMFADHFLHGG
jgi:DNA (cytosine-5)-methyltransferase 1